jgi:hypothetical protein
MKNAYLAMIVLLAVSLPLVTEAQPASDPPRLYYGVRIGGMFNSVDGMDTPLQGGAAVGYRLSTQLPISIEAEFTTTILWGAVAIPFVASGEWSIQTVAVRAAYVSTGPWFYSARIGMLNEDVKMELIGYNVHTDDSGMSFAIGGGRRLKFGTLELSYAIVEQDVSFFSLGFFIGL